MRATPILRVIQATRWVAIWLVALTCATTTAFSQEQPPSLVKVVENGDMAALRARLSSGANPNEPDDSAVKGRTPLMAAAYSGNVEAVRLLLDAGAAINAKNEYGATALDIAIRGGRPQVAEFLRSHGGKRGQGQEATATRPEPPTTQGQDDSAVTSEKVAQGKRLVVYFHFDPSCENCAAMAPNVQRFYEERGSTYDVRGLVITGRGNPAAVRAFRQSHGITFPIIDYPLTASVAPRGSPFGFGFQGEKRYRESVPPAVSRTHASINGHPVISVFNRGTGVSRVASVGYVSYAVMSDHVDAISRGVTGAHAQGST